LHVAHSQYSDQGSTVKLKFENLSNFASQVGSASSRGYSVIQQQVSEAGASALEVGESIHHSLAEVLDQIPTDKAAARAKELVQSATAGTQKWGNHIVDIAQKADPNHKEVAEGIETVSMGLGIAAGVTAAGAAIAAPTGLSAVGIALGIGSAPLIVAAAPAIAVAATTAGVISGGAYFYSMWRSKGAEDADDNSTSEKEVSKSQQQGEQST
jgi:hypothetical protein